MSYFRCTGVNELRNALRSSPRSVQTGINSALRESGELLKNEAKKLALKDTGNLRKNIKRDPVSRGGNGNTTFTEVVHSNAYAKRGAQKGRFNYAYYLHEVKRHVRNPTTPGTTPIHLEKAGKTHLTEEKYKSIIEKHVKLQLNTKGWGV